MMKKTELNSKRTSKKFQENAVMICTFIGAMAIAEGTVKMYKKAKLAARNKKNQEASKKDASVTNDSYDQNYNKTSPFLSLL